MPITLADIDRWDAAAVRDVSTALGKRGANADEVRNGLAKLPMIATWQGSGGDAARAALEKLSRHLAAHAQEMAAIASATSKSADEIEAVKDTLKGIYRDAKSEGFSIDPETGAVTPLHPDRMRNDPVYWIEEKDLETRIGKVLTAGNAADADLARALTTAGNDATGPAEDRPEVRAQMTNPPTDPQEFEDFWAKLTPEEKNWMYDQDHFIGNHPGMPFVDRSELNERHLPELIAPARAEVDRLRNQHPDWAASDQQFPYSVTPQQYGQYADWKKQWDAATTKLKGLDAVSQTMSKDDGYHRFLATIDDQGHAAVAIGNPDEATRTAPLVPGTGRDLAAFNGSDDKSVDMLRAALDADPTLTVKDVSVTTWMGYDRPMDLGQAASPDYARSGADALDSYVNGMHASHQGPPAVDTVVGHSYGTTMVGAAAEGGHHLAVDNVIAVGSPGMLVDTAGQLNLDPNANVYATRARFDPINIATGFTLGPNPTNEGFGAVRLAAAPGPSSGYDLPSIEAHSSYWDEGNPALANMGAVIAGMPPPHVLP
ncbi:MAG: hypothetical protein QOJ95_5609 [Mycobacterium sp.]|nr:hypothetical protein [Mycobacterium sp.]